MSLHYSCVSEIVRLSLLNFFSLEAARMPTAIAAMKTSGGFVAAADGLSGKLEDDGTFKVLDSQVQKVFRLEGFGKHLTWTVSGNADVRSDDGNIAIDLIDVIGNCAKAFLVIDAANLSAFADGIGRCVNDSLRAAKAEEKFTKYADNPSGDIFRMFIQGYYNGRPEQCARRFWHKDQVLQEPEDRTEADIVENRYLTGSGTVLNAIFEHSNVKLSAYNLAGYYTIVEAVEFARKCIEVHMTKEARTIDSITCRAIGGRTHIATITKAQGVQWVPGFEPIDERVW